MLTRKGWLAVGGVGIAAYLLRPRAPATSNSGFNINDPANFVTGGMFDVGQPPNPAATPARGRPQVQAPPPPVLTDPTSIRSGTGAGGAGFPQLDTFQGETNADAANDPLNDVSTPIDQQQPDQIKAFVDWVSNWWSDIWSVNAAANTDPATGQFFKDTTP